jgi:oligopeptide transport system permease protein
MSAVLSEPTSLDDARTSSSEGVWHAAWRRFKADRVGLVSWSSCWPSCC